MKTRFPGLRGGDVKLEIELHLVSLAEELKKVLQENLTRGRSEAAAAMARARAIREEIISYGCIVTWSAEIDPRNPGNINVDVTLWKPKADMTIENQKLYDNWFNKTDNPAN